MRKSDIRVDMNLLLSFPLKVKTIHTRACTHTHFSCSSSYYFIIVVMPMYISQYLNFVSVIEVG